MLVSSTRQVYTNIPMHPHICTYICRRSMLDHFTGLFAWQVKHAQRNSVRTKRRIEECVKILKFYCPTRVTLWLWFASQTIHVKRERLSRSRGINLLIKTNENNMNYGQRKQRLIRVKAAKFNIFTFISDKSHTCVCMCVVYVCQHFNEIVQMFLCLSNTRTFRIPRNATCVI